MKSARSMRISLRFYGSLSLAFAIGVAAVAWPDLGVWEIAAIALLLVGSGMNFYLVRKVRGSTE
jgi:hypothetical protein